MAKAKKVVEAPKKKRGQGFKRVGQYFKNIIAELKKVTWPTRKTVVSYTGLVLAFIVVFAVVVGLMDVGLTKLLELIMKGSAS